MGAGRRPSPRLCTPPPAPPPGRPGRGGPGSRRVTNGGGAEPRGARTALRPPLGSPSSARPRGPRADRVQAGPGRHCGSQASGLAVGGGGGAGPLAAWARRLRGLRPGASLTQLPLLGGNSRVLFKLNQTAGRKGLVFGEELLFSFQFNSKAVRARPHGRACRLRHSSPATSPGPAFPLWGRTKRPQARSKGLGRQPKA